MTAPRIETPRGTVAVNEDGVARLQWSTTFRPKWQGQFDRAQVFVDSEVLRLCEPYTPLLTGMLVMSGSLGTEVGSGLVQWIAPYARAQYYLPRKPGTMTGPLRGPRWFHRMKAVHGRQILAGARRLAGGGR